MKTLFIWGFLAFMCITVHAQTNILKTKALFYIKHQLIKPNTYSSINWSQVSTLKDEYIIMNIFNAENYGGEVTKLLYSFHFDKQFNLIYVNTDPIEKQLADMKSDIKRANENIQRIKQTRDQQIQNLNKQ